MVGSQLMVEECLGHQVFTLVWSIFWTKFKLVLQV